MKPQGDGYAETGLLLVSLGSRSITTNYIANVAQLSSNECVALIVCFLDIPEIFNLKFLAGLDDEDAYDQVSRRCEELISALAECDLHQHVRIASYSQFRDDERFERYETVVEREYESSASFRSHCRNQVFRNLQPILRGKGIMSKRNKVTADLARYLVHEIALKLFLADSRLATIEYAPEPEMAIMDAIYDGRYPGLLHLAKVRMRHLVVPSRSPLPTTIRYFGQGCPPSNE